MFDRIQAQLNAARVEHGRHIQAMWMLRQAVSAVQQECRHEDADPDGDSARCPDCGAERKFGEWRPYPDILGECRTCQRGEE